MPTWSNDQREEDLFWSHTSLYSLNGIFYPQNYFRNFVCISFFSLFIYLFIFSFFVFLFVQIFIYSIITEHKVSFFIFLSMCLSMCQHVSLLVCLSVSLYFFFRLKVWMFFCLCFCLFVCLFVWHLSITVIITSMCRHCCHNF